MENTLMHGTPRLHGKRAIITGAASGIGRAVAIRFAESGASVALLDVDKRGLLATEELLSTSAADVLSIPTDVSDEAQVRRATAECVTRWGSIDTVVGVAGIELDGQGEAPIHELDLETWNRTLAVNLTGMFLTAKHGIGAILNTSGHGSVILTGSPCATLGVCRGEPAYSASKGGVHGLVRNMAVDYAARGVRVNCVVPGVIDTPLNEDAFSHPEVRLALKSSIPTGQIGTPPQIAPIYVYLASDESAYMTGAFLVIDGGLASV